jgi:hypothetical protein
MALFSTSLFPSHSLLNFLSGSLLILPICYIWVPKGWNFLKLSLGSETWHEALSIKNMRIPHPPKNQGSPYQPHHAIFGPTNVFFSQKLSNVSKTSGMNSYWIGKMFQFDSADTCAGNLKLMLMRGRVNGQACTDGHRGPPSA